MGPSTTEPPLSITVGNGQSQQTLAISSHSRPTQIHNIFEWTDLFLTFAAVFSERYPHQAPTLFWYCNVIRSLSRRCPLQWWLFYDSQFRRLKAQDPSMSWGAIHQELYLHCLSQAPGSLQPGSNANESNSRSKPMRRGPEGVCWQQWNDGNCDKENCRFRHLTSEATSGTSGKGAPQRSARHHAPHRSNHPGGQNSH